MRKYQKGEIDEFKCINARKFIRTSFIITSYPV